MTDDTKDWKTQVSNETGVPADVLRGNTLEDIEEHAEALKGLLPPPGPAAGYVPSEGRTVAKALPAPRVQFAAFLEHQLNPPRR